MQPGRKLPPFGKALADAVLRGLQPKGRQVMIYADCWPPSPAPFVSLTLPWDAAPEAFDWRMVAGLDAFVKVPAPCDDDRLHRLLTELVACKPRRLIVLQGTAPHARFIVSAARGLEVQP